MTESEKNTIASFFPLPIQTKAQRAEFRKKYEDVVLAPGKRSYEELDYIIEPDPNMNHTRGGSGNNRNARMINALLAFLLYDDWPCLDQALIWGRHFTNQLMKGLGGWDSGHVQDHPNLFPLAVIDDTIEVGAFQSYGYFLGNQYVAYVPPGKPSLTYWQIGIAGTRPLTRALGAAFRFAAHAKRYDSLIGRNPGFELNGLNSPDVLRQQAADRWSQVYSWTSSSNPKRFWTGDNGNDVRQWPFLPSPNPATINRYVRWFHLGIIWPFEIVSNIAYGFDNKIQRARARDLCTWALNIGWSLKYGQHLRGNPFRPDAEHLQIPMRHRDTLERDGHWDGEPEYSILPALVLARGSLRQKTKVMKSFSLMTRSIRPGEVAFDTCLALNLV